jgi:hypothetical protein
MTLPAKIFSLLRGNLCHNFMFISCLRGISAQLHENIDDEISSKPTGRRLFTFE